MELRDGGTASPGELAKSLDEPLGNISYHTRLLSDLGVFELVRQTPRRGAIESFYRLRPWVLKEMGEVEHLAAKDETVPVHPRRYVKVEAAMDAFAGAPPIDLNRFREDIDTFVDQDSTPRA